MGKEFYGKPMMEVIEIEDDAIRTSGGHEICPDGGCAPVAVCVDCGLDGVFFPIEGGTGSLVC